jgi:hypothetical protein
MVGEVDEEEVPCREAGPTSDLKIGTENRTIGGCLPGLATARLFPSTIERSDKTAGQPAGQLAALWRSKQQAASSK